MTLIALQVKKYYVQTVSQATLAKALWSHLAATHQANSSARVAVLRKEFLSLHKATDEPVSVHLERAKSLWNKLADIVLDSSCSP